MIIAGLGSRLLQKSITPRWLKFLILKRWDRRLWKLEKAERSKKNDNIFEITHGHNASVKFELPVLKDMISGNIIVKKQFFEQEYLKSISSILKNPSCIIDVGANIGNHTVYFARQWSDCVIHAIEPISLAFQILKRNISLNQFQNVYCHNIALGDRHGIGSITHDGLTENNLGATRVNYTTSGNISFKTMDDFIENLKIGKIDLIKIDVEGFELKVLDGMKDTILKHNPIIWIEVLESNTDNAMKYFRNNGVEFISALNFNTNNDYLIKLKPD